MARFDLRVNVVEQNLHVNDSGLTWVLECLRRKCSFKNTLGHCVQGNMTAVEDCGGGGKCVRRWLYRLFAREKVLLQTPHTNGCSAVCSRMCSRSKYGNWKACAHSLQGYRICVRTCVHTPREFPEFPMDAVALEAALLWEAGRPCGYVRWILNQWCNGVDARVATNVAFIIDPDYEDDPLAQKLVAELKDFNERVRRRDKLFRIPLPPHLLEGMCEFL